MEQIPKYFYYEEQVDIRTEIEGVVSGITLNGETAQIEVSGEDEFTESYTVPAGGIVVNENDTVFMGDVLGRETKWQAGLLLVGLWVTLKVSSIAIVFGVILGLLTGLARISESCIADVGNYLY